jgi:streptomycin 6-kinase
VQRGSLLLRRRDDLVAARASLPLEVVAAVFFVAQRIEPSLQLGHFRVQRLARPARDELVLELVGGQSGAGDQELDVAGAVAPEPRPPQLLAMLLRVLWRGHTAILLRGNVLYGVGLRCRSLGPAPYLYGEGVSDRPDLVPLVETAEAVAAEWGVHLGPPFALSRYSYVAPAGDDAVLKVIPLSDDESDHDADALELWGGDGAVRLLRWDRERRTMLMERARPGADISKLPEDDATAIAIKVGRRLWRPAGAPFRWIGDHVPVWLDNAERDGGNGAELIPLARELYEGLEPARATLVHGDFHHHNILRHGERFVAIDSKAMLGEPEYDVPSFLWNPLQPDGWGSMPLERTLRRLAAFEAAGLDPKRMRAWTVIRGAYLGAFGDEVETILELVGS